MKAKFLTLSAFAAMAFAGVAPAVAEDAAALKAAAYAATVDPSAFHDVPLERKKLGVTTSPATVRLISPGMDKFSIYPLIGPPHFGEGITRRWNYVLFFPAGPNGAERVRCRMEIRFARARGQYDVVVSKVIWQEQSCADRVAAAS